MNIFLVGGAVRDGLLGLPVTERDWVVVGADPETMRAQGFVDADREFPVFIHPETGEEYALARRERKTGEGYRGFSVDCGPDVTLDEDLRRRDLTVNAMAQDEHGSVIDPFNGRDDLDAGLLRHVSPAFVEDPVRVVRAARFAARLGRFGFRVAHPTHRLMRQMVADGEMAHLTRERFWRELRRALATEQPWRFFEVLHRCGALDVLLPALGNAMGPIQSHATDADSGPVSALQRVCALTPDPAQRLCAALACCVDSVAAAARLADDLRADRETSRLLRLIATNRELCVAANSGDTDAVIGLVSRARGFDSDESLPALVNVCMSQRPGSVLADSVEIAVSAGRAVTVGDLQARGLSGRALGQALAAAREEAARKALRDTATGRDEEGLAHGD